MEQEKTFNQPESEKKIKSLKRYLLLALLFSLLSLLFSAYLIMQLMNEKENIVVKTAAINKSENDKKDLLTKLKNMEGEYDQMITEYEDLDSLFINEKEKIVALQNEIKNFSGTTEQYKKKVLELENRLKDYMNQISELKSQNKALSSDNITIKSSLDSAVLKNSSLTVENKDLHTKVKQGSVLKAYEMVSYGVRLKGTQEIVTQKAKKVQRVRICFMISENALVTKGNKSIYLRIVGPDQNILTIGKDDANMFNYEGKEIAYSIKKDVYYDNKAMDMCVYWDKTKEFQRGVYDVDIFIDDYQLGSSSFKLE